MEMEIEIEIEIEIPSQAHLAELWVFHFVPAKK